MHGCYIGKIQISLILRGKGKLHGDNRDKLRNFNLIAQQLDQSNFSMLWLNDSSEIIMHILLDLSQYIKLLCTLGSIM